MSKTQIYNPYKGFGALDSYGILHPQLYQAIDWGLNDICAIAIDNKVYFIKIEKNAPSDYIETCDEDYRVTAVTWMESVLN